MVISVFGLGFVGLTTALGFSELGHKVYGIEVNPERKATIASGKLPFFEPELDTALVRHLDKQFFLVDQLEQAIAESDVVYYCVGTPYGEDGQADLTYLYGAVEETLKEISDDKFRVLVTKSTIPPSTTREKIIPFIEKKGVTVGKDLGVCNNPEFLREGYCWDDFMNTDRVVLGTSDEKSAEILRKLYEALKAPVYCVSLNTGEFIKYLSNTLLATLISYANEMSLLADQMGDIDVAEAFKILHMDKRWDDCDMKNYFYPGCGYGGYCLPKDTNALYAVANNKGYSAEILKNVIALNDNMCIHMTDRIEKVVAGKQDCKIGFLGLSFKPNSDDVRDASSAKLMAELKKRNFNNLYGYDPIANEEFEKYHGHLGCQYADSVEELLETADVLVLATAWAQFKGLKEKTNKTIVDCRYFL